MKYSVRLNHSFRASSVMSIITEPISHFQIDLFNCISLTTSPHVKYTKLQKL